MNRSTAMHISSGRATDCKIDAKAYSGNAELAGETSSGSTSPEFRKS